MAWEDEGCLINGAATLKGFECLFRNILNASLQIAIVVIFIIIVIGGFKYLTSGGDPKAVESAKKTLTYAILGAVLLIVVWLVLKLIYQITGVNVTIFKIGLP